MIADRLQLPSADEDIFKALDTAPPLDPTVATAAWGDRFDASELVLINGALAGYAEYFSGGSLGDLVWAPNLFIVGDTHQWLTGPIDITGRSRCLIYGPYIRLPPGRWNADVTVAFAELGGSKDFIIDVAATVKLHEVSINVINQGGGANQLALCPRSGKRGCGGGSSDQQPGCFRRAACPRCCDLEASARFAEGVA
jgi:hypothetical protein